jgi:beta-lactamase class A
MDRTHRFRPLRTRLAGRPFARAGRAVLALTATAVLAACSGTTGGTTTTAFVATQTGTPGSIGIDVTDVMKTATPAALNAYIDAKGDHSAVAVLDRTTGISINVNEDKVFQTASIVKFDILATRLYQTQQSGGSLTGSEKTLAFAMITQSDNNAASALYSLDHGASGVTAANKVFGLKDTVPNSSWGRTRTTAGDQILLLKAVFDPKGPLSDASRNYMRSLMSQVEKDQAWGITAAATPDATGVYVKNGWVEMDAYGHMEGDNSVGRITEPGHDWLIAAMSNYNRTDAAGEKILDALSEMAVSGLRIQTKS